MATIFASNKWFNLFYGDGDLGFFLFFFFPELSDLSLCQSLVRHRLATTLFQMSGPWQPQYLKEVQMYIAVSQWRQ